MADNKDIVRWEVSKKTGNKRPVYKDGTYGPVVKATEAKKETPSNGANTHAQTSRTPGYVDSADPAEKARLASSNPDKVLTQEQYDELDNLRTAAIAQGRGGGKNEATRLYQQKFHEYLPDVAKSIIASEPTTTHGKSNNLSSIDLSSNEDGLFGKRTERYNQALGNYKPKPGTVAPGVDTKLPAKTAADVAREDFKRNPIKDNIQPEPSHGPWWLQDIVGTAGAAGDFLRVKKYNPWQATPGVTYAQPTFYDPTRELAASAEQTNIGAKALAQFTGPQQFNARFNQLQGQGFKNAADIMGRYNNLNVGVANQVAGDNANTYNAYSQHKADLNTQLFDKYTIANQQFDNAKNQARQNLRNQYIHAVTNKNYTQNLNDLYPQYAVDPSIGGRMFFHDGRNLTGDEHTPDYAQMYEKALRDYPTAASTEAGRNQLAKFIQAQAGIQDESSHNAKMMAMMMGPQQ